MRFASVKRIMETFPDLSREEASLLRDIVRGDIDPLEMDGPVGDHARSFARRLYSRASQDRVAMEAISALVGLDIAGWCVRGTNYRGGIDYLNVGDPYIPTVIHNSCTGSWHIGCYADVVDRYPSVCD
jgi:hypothetical protein